MKSIGRIAGGIGTLVNAGLNVRWLQGEGYTMGRAVLRVATGYDSSTTNGVIECGLRALEECWWPGIVGEAAHQAIGRSRGIMDSGIGLKLNMSLPKGINI